MGILLFTIVPNVYPNDFDPETHTVTIIKDIVEAGAPTIPDAFRERAIKFYSDISHVGEATPIKTGETIICYEVPLFTDNKINIANIYLSTSPKYVVEWPGWRMDEVPEALETEDSFFDEGSMISSFFSESLFIAPTLISTSSPSFLQRTGLPGEGKAMNRHFGSPLDPKDADFLIEGWDKIPYKNIAPSSEWINYVNGQFDRGWKFQKGIRVSSNKCNSYSASFIADWWTIVKAGKKINQYTNFYRGDTELGTSPRKLELIYRVRAGEDPETYKSINFMRDMITRESSLSSLEAYAKILSTPWGEFTVNDPLIPSITHISKGNLTGISGYKILFQTPDPDSEKILSQALENDGILLAGLTYRHRGVPVFRSVHTVAIIGYTDVGKKRYFIYKENYGEFPWDKPEDSEGGPSYRMMPAEEFFEAYAFY